MMTHNYYAESFLSSSYLSKLSNVLQEVFTRLYLSAFTTRLELHSLAHTNTFLIVKLTCFKLFYSQPVNLN